MCPINYKCIGKSSDYSCHGGSGCIGISIGCSRRTTRGPCGKIISICRSSDSQSWPSIHGGIRTTPSSWRIPGINLHEIIIVDLYLCTVTNDDPKIIGPCGTS